MKLEYSTGPTVLAGPARTTAPNLLGMRAHRQDAFRRLRNLTERIGLRVGLQSKGRLPPVE